MSSPDHGFMKPHQVDGSGLDAARFCVKMIDLRLKGRRVFGLVVKPPLKIVQDRHQLREAPLDGSVVLDATSFGGAFSNGLL